MTGRLTLHEAMITVLRSHGGDWMDRDAIAREIAARDLFRRPSDGAHPPSDQLRLRARRYPHLFECSDTGCSKIRLQKLSRPAASPPAPSRAARRLHPDARESPSFERAERTEAGGGGEWYERLRDLYRPAELRVLLIGESPPDPGGGERRFFYAPVLARYDNLYRGVAEAVYGEESDFDVADKQETLERLKEDGFWLIDAVESPINKSTRSSRKHAIEASAPRLAERCAELSPRAGVIICHGVVFEAAADAVRERGVKLLHDTAIPFPLGNWRKEFVKRFRAAMP